MFSNHLRDQLQEIGDHSIQAHIDRFDDVPAGRGEKLPRQRSCPFPTAQYFVQIRKSILVSRKLRPKDLAKTEDPRQRVVEIVRDPPRESSHRFHPLCGLNLPPELPLAGDISFYRDVIDDLPGRAEYRRYGRLLLVEGAVFPP